MPAEARSRASQDIGEAGGGMDGGEGRSSEGVVGFGASWQVVVGVLSVLRPHCLVYLIL